MPRLHFVKYAVLIICLLLTSFSLEAQDILKGKDLSQVKVDQLSDGDILKLKSQLTSSNMTIDQAEQLALSKGMPPAEFAKLKRRLQDLGDDKDKNAATGRLKSQDQKGSGERENNSSDSLDVGKYNEKPQSFIDPLIFGSELYTSASPSFEPNLKLATPVNYVIGPEDQLQVTVYGVQEYNGDLLVSPEGTINIPNIGQVKVAGLTIEAATQRLKTLMGNSVYPYLKTGGAKLSITLSKIRSIKVTVIGANKPGNYTLSSLSTVFNALFVSGGPRSFGSFREIELVRNNETIRKIDLYRFLLHGDQSDNIGLKDNDVIRIPAYKKRVELQGQVKRPGIFEVLPSEQFADILSFASGFTDTAYMASVKVYQRDAKERKVYDLTAADFTTYVPQSGDVFIVSKILNRFQNRVRITGAVFRPDIYELTPGMTAADLIRKADGLREDAYGNRGQILRIEEDLSRSIISFDITKSLAGDMANNPTLQREDEILISAISDLRDSFKVNIQGEIRIPGQYDYVAGLKLGDLILQAGGFTDAAFKSIEIARLIKRDSLSFADRRSSVVMNVLIKDQDFSSSSQVANILLQPFDVITIRRKAGYSIPETVTVTGMVQYPGPYAISKSDERISDLLVRAGGYAPDAYPKGAYLKRYKTDQEKSKSEEVFNKLDKKISRDTAQKIDENTLRELRKDYDQIPLDMETIMQDPGSIKDITVKAKDELYIPKFDAEVKIHGGVLLETQLPFDPKNTFIDYISAAGGYSADALKKKAYIVYANGKAAITKRFLFFKSYPRVEPGSTLVVPKKIEKKGLSAAEVLAFTTGLASLAAIIVSLIN